MENKKFQYKKEPLDWGIITIIIFTVIVFGFIFYGTAYFSGDDRLLRDLNDPSQVRDLYEQRNELERQIQEYQQDQDFVDNN